MQLCFFEDDTFTNFLPLTLTRPISDLRIGILTLAEKWYYALKNAKSTQFVRNDLKVVFPQQKLDPGKSALWINSRYLPSNDLQKKIKGLDEGTCIKSGRTVIAAKVDAETTAEWVKTGEYDFNSLMVVESSNYSCITNLWELFLKNSDEIHSDLERLNYPSSNKNTVSSQSILKNEDQIFINEDALIEPGAILLADDGPIFIGKEATVMAGALIKGPAAICENSTVKMGAKIYPNTTIGPWCKVSGEISDSIFHSYSNKGHDGYIGNSLIGQWCNLGAGTTISNLKNNYSPVRFTDWSSGEPVETGRQFLGTIMGDHSKTAINTRLNTGTACGVSCNIFSADFPPKYIPSFSWVGSNVIQPYNLEKALETMQAMMARRDVELTEDYKKMMETIFEKEHS